MKSKVTATVELFIGVLGILTGLWFAFFYAPVESQMGIVQKIFYFHVPSAYSMYLSWLVCTVASVLYIVRNTERWDMLAKSSAELALMFSIMVMITGPIWGRKSWGAFWVWDPRLTSALMLTLVITSYVLLRQLAKGEAVRKFSAAIAIVGAALIPLVHISVYKWRGQHPTVLRSGGLDPKMLQAFLACMFIFTVIFILLLRRRYRLEQKIRQLGSLREQLLAEDADNDNLKEATP